MCTAALLLLLPWLADRFDLPWRYVFGPWIVPLLVIAAVTHLAYAIPSVALRAWLAFRLDRRVGLSTAPVSRFLRVTSIDLVFGLLPLLALAVALWWVIRRHDDWWILEVWGLLAAHTVAGFAAWPLRLSVAYGTVPTPPDLVEAVHDIAGRIGVRRPRVNVLWSSDLRAAPNAMVSGLGPTTTISVYDSILELPPSERDAILAHEFGHVRNHDGGKRVLMTAGLSVVVALGVQLLGTGWPFGDWGFEPVVSSPGAYPAFVTLFLCVHGYIALAVVNAIGRRSEVAADQFALGAIDDPCAFRDAIIRVSAHNRLALASSGPIASVTCTHPPGEQRVALVDEWLRRRDLTCG